MTCRVIFPTKKSDIRPSLEDRKKPFHWLKSPSNKFMPAEYREQDGDAFYFLIGEVCELDAAFAGNSGWKYLGVCKYEKRVKP